MKLANQTAVITGAGSGMGEAVARHFASLGLKVALLDLNFEAVKKVADDLNGCAYEVDVSNEESAEKAITQIQEQLGNIRICVNCAGVAPAKRIVGRNGPMPLDDFATVIKINLIGSFNIMRLSANAMAQLDPLEDGERGVIINTASVAAFDGQIGQAAYSASKGGIVGMTLPAARELARFGIRVMTIAPGIVGTPMLLNMPEVVQASLAQQVPFPKRLAKPNEYAMLAQHIVENSYLNGEVIRLDGAIRMAEK